jgi:hypothetical protein
MIEDKQYSTKLDCLMSIDKNNYLSKSTYFKGELQTVDHFEMIGCFLGI